jgi:hypothetical protein
MFPGALPMRKPAWLLRWVIPAVAMARRVRKTPVFLVGTQRSGTTMLTDILGRVPLCRAYHEADNAVMEDMRLQEREVVERVINSEVRPLLIFKPINDSQCTLDFLETYNNARAVWIYRDYNDVANSALRTRARRPRNRTSGSPYTGNA